MLLLPKRHERRLKPVAHGAKPVDTRMARRTERDKKTRLMDAGAAVMDGEYAVCPTGAASATVTI